MIESVSCKGVKWHELDGFARLQAARLAPFIQCGANAVIRDKTLMLWFWDENEVEAAFQAAGSTGRNFRKIAETLMLDVPARSGEFKLACTTGTDMLTLSQGAIMASRWVPNGVTPFGNGGELRSNPWARDRLKTSTQAGRSSPWLLTPRNALLAVSVMSAASMGAYAAYWGGRVYGMEERLALLGTTASKEDVNAGEVSRRRQAAATDKAWVEQYIALGSGLDWNGLLGALAKPLEAQAVVVKEIEAKNSEVRLSLVASGGTLDVPGMLKALEDTAGFEDVQVRQTPDPTQAIYSLRASGFRTLPGSTKAPGPGAFN